MNATAPTLPPDIAERAATLGHQPLTAIEGNYDPTFECPRCRGLAMGDHQGWSGWAVEYDCERVQLVTGR